MIKRTVLLFVISLVLVAHPTFGQGDKAKKVDEFIAPFAAANQFAGQVVVAYDGKMVYEKAFGVANAEYKIPNQLNTRIGIASITKYMTLIILQRLVEA